jgi:hypothetical protein
MSDEIIDITRYFERDPVEEVLPRTIALWGADGERSRFALPLWRVVHLAGGERGVILWRNATGDRAPQPFVVIDLDCDPARLDLDGASVDCCEAAETATLHDLGSAGLVIYLGSRNGRIWCLFAEGGESRRAPLDPKKREDILFLAGECAGLLFLRDLADGAEDDP